METLILSTATWFALHQKELTNILEEYSLKCLSARAHKYSRRIICRNPGRPHKYSRKVPEQDWQ
jgi:hypothetical protein